MKDRTAWLAGDESPEGKAAAGDCLNDAQEVVKGVMKWSFMIALDGSITLLADTDVYDLPDTIMVPNRIYYKDNQGIPIPVDPCSDADFINDYADRSSSNPLKYRLVSLSSTNHKTRIQLGPPPSTTHISNFGSDLYIEQFSDPTPLTRENQYHDFPGGFTKVLEYLAASMMCAAQNNTSRASTYSQVYEGLIRPLKAADKLRYGKLFPIKPGLAAAAGMGGRRSRRPRR